MQNLEYHFCQIFQNVMLITIGGYFINGYWWLFRYKPLVIILLVVIDGYFINGYCIISYYWLLYVILQLLVVIIL
jgi:hypothetical protein